MMAIRTLINKLVIVFCFLLIGFSGNVFAELEVIQSSVITTVLPRNQEAEVMFFKFRQVGNPADPDESLTSLTVGNSSEVSFGPNRIKKVTVFRDANSNSTFDSADIEIGSTTFSQNKILQVVSLTAFALNNTQPDVGVFVVYQVDDAAEVNGISQVELLDINQQGTSPRNNGNVLSSAITISGYNQITVANQITPEFVVPSSEDERIGMISLVVSVVGEQTENQVQIEIENNQNNFVTGNSKEGVVGVTVYNVQNDLQLTQWDPSQFVEENVNVVSTDENVISSSKVRLSVNVSGGLGNGEKKFLILYDLGEDISIDDSTKISAKLSSISVDGSSSGLAIVGPSSDDLNAFTVGSSDVAGLGVSNLSRIVPTLAGEDLSFGVEQQFPLLGFTIQSHLTTTNVSSISIETNAIIDFRTITANSTDIVKLDIYEDSDSSGDFSGFNSNDRLIGTLELGNGNQNNKAVVPINQLSSDYEIAPFNSNLDYPDNNEKRVFVIYHIGQQLTLENGVANALLGNIRGNILNPFDELQRLDIQLSGTKPLAPTPAASITIETTQIYIRSVEPVAPETVFSGSKKVPMLKLELEATQAFSNVNLVIQNAQNNFFASGLGVNKVWLYQDVNPENNTFDDNNDVQLAAIVPTDVDKVTLRDISFSIGTNHFFVLYDIGDQMEDVFSAQLFGVDITNDNLIFGGELPSPRTQTNSQSLARLVEIDSVVVRPEDDLTQTLTEISKSTGTFRVQVSVTNTSNSIIQTNRVYPKIYDVGTGKDITDEFTSNIIGNEVVTIEARRSHTFSFDVEHINFLTEGFARFDAFVKYQDPNNNTFLPEISRFIENDVIKNAANIVSDLELIGVDESYSFQYPSYINTVVHKNDNSIVFGSGNAIRQNEGLKITFKNNGQNIDFGSIQLSLNGVRLQAGQTGATSIRAASSSSFSIDEDEGAVTIDSLGTTSGQIIMSVQDNLGNQLDDTIINFSISSTLSLSDLLFFPNPFIIGSQDLELGFNLTQAGTAEIYIVNFLGQIVYQNTHEGTIGYNTHIINSLNSFLSSGHYLCRVIVKGSNGSDSATTKLVIY